MEKFQCLCVEEQDGDYQVNIRKREISDLPDNDVLIKVAYSALNYKDALSCSGNRAVTREYPHQPGIDAAGVVVESNDDRFKPDDLVIVTGYDLGMNTAGGLGEYIRVPGNWIVPLPSSLTLKKSMMFGTAGLTAALCIQKLESAGIHTDDGQVLVTGATGGVGAIAVSLLKARGYRVTAMTGKADQHDYLKSIGADDIVSRDILDTASNKPMLKPLFAAAIDVAGGDTLATLLKIIEPEGAVACCGLVDSPALNTTVMPFIIRGVSLLGVDSVEIPLATKTAAWQLIAQQIPSAIEQINDTISLAQAPAQIHEILRGKGTRHYVVQIASD